MTELEIECALLVMRARATPICATEMYLDFAEDLLKAIREETEKREKEESK